MIEQGTLSWQKGTSEFKRLRMPKLRLFLFLWRIEGRVFFHLDNESDLG